MKVLVEDSELVRMTDSRVANYFLNRGWERTDTIDPAENYLMVVPEDRKEHGFIMYPKDHGFIPLVLELPQDLLYVGDYSTTEGKFSSVNPFHFYSFAPQGDAFLPKRELRHHGHGDYVISYNHLLRADSKVWEEFRETCLERDPLLVQGEPLKR